MWRKERTIYTLFDREPVRSIILLLYEFEDKKFLGKTGLFQMQFRYALEKGYILKDQKIEDPQKERNMMRLKEFFGNQLLFPIGKFGKIKRDCITSRQHINYYLQKLEKEEFIESKGKSRKKRYFLTNKISILQAKVDYQESIKNFEIKNIHLFRSDKPHVYNILYGLSSKKFKKKENEIMNLIDEIDKKIIDLEKFLLDENNKDSYIVYSRFKTDMSY